MRRLHLLELEDQPWLPATIRDALTDYLTFIAEGPDLPFRAFAAKLGAALTRLGTHTLVDMGTGGGGPVVAIAKVLRRTTHADVDVVLTDLFPNKMRLELSRRRAAVPVTIVDQPVDATGVPPDLAGFRTMCNAFHHLPEPVALACLTDAVRQRRGIAVLEMVDRTPGGFLQLLTGMLALPFITPFVPPFRWSRLVFTYLVPVIPFVVLFDGIVSCLRIYSPAELRELVSRVPGEAAYEWDIGQLPVPFTPLRPTYLIGVPRDSTGTGI